MPGDPKECREHARRCAELAKAATTQEAREQFLSLQMSWIRLAADLDNAKAFIDALERDGRRPAGQGRGVAAEYSAGRSSVPGGDVHAVGPRLAKLQDVLDKAKCLGLGWLNDGGGSPPSKDLEYSPGDERATS